MNLVNTAKNYGCHDVVQLDSEPSPRHLEYLDLLKTSGPERLKVSAIAEFQSRPLLYIVSGDQIRDIDNNKVLNLQRLPTGERGHISVF